MTYTIEDIGKFKVVHLIGDVRTNEEAKAMTLELNKLAKKGHWNFCFNLEQANYLDSSGISIFIHTLAMTENGKGSVFMVVLEPEVKDVIELAGLDKLIKTYSTMDEFKKDHQL